MAEDLDDGEFWLPSHFLTDDDILMDFGFKPEHLPGQGSGTDTLSSNSDLELASGSTETESDEDDLLLSGLTRNMTRSNLHDSPPCPVHSKGMVLSSSPQSTLCGCVCNQGSSRESLSGPVSPPKNGDNTSNATLDLLNKAAGEVARLKMKTEKKSTTGTGFFDCSQKGILYPAPLPNPDHFPPLYFQPQFHHFPPMVWPPYNQPKQQPQNRATKNNNGNQKKSNSNNNNNEKNGSNSRPLGLPPSAWPPLQLQAQAIPNGPMFSGPKRECAGTGVFLPRRVNTPNKSEGNTPKTKPVKGPQPHNRRNNNRTPPSTTNNNNNNNEIQLPQEWTY